MRILSAILFVLGPVLLVCAQSAPDSGPMRYEVPIGRTAHSPLVVPELGYVSGAHPYRSVIVGRIESAGLDKPVGVIGVVLRDFTLDGDGDTSKFPQTDRRDPQKYVSGPPGIRVRSYGARLEGLSVTNVAGPGIVFERASGMSSRWQEPGSQTEGRIANVTIERCYDGLLVHSGDTLLSNVVVGSVRGNGIEAGSATTLTGCHVYGAQGAGILIRYCSYLSNNVSENCGDGILNEGGGTHIDCQRVFGCWRTGIDLRAWAIVSNTRITAGRENSVALRIGPKARHSVINAELDLASTATGAIVSAHKTDLTIRRSWGGSRTVIIDEPVTGCRLDVCVDGSAVGVEIQKLGTGNRIEITARQCKTPLVLPPRGVHESNVITVNGKPYRGS